MKLQKLQRDVVVRTALRLLNEVGLDGLTTRRLALELGVQSPALYWHFKNKRALLDEMAEAMLAETSPREMELGGDWREWVIENARSFRRALLSYRDGARVHAGTRPSAADFPIIESQTRALCAAGFTAPDALRIGLVVGRYVIGWVLEEQAGAEDAPERGAEPLSDSAFEGYPLLAQGAHIFRQTDPDADFDFGLRVFVAGLEAELLRSACGPR